MADGVYQTGKLDSGVQEQQASGLTDFLDHAADSFKYTLVQAPLSGVTQLMDHFNHTDYEAHCQIFAPPKAAEFGSAGWVGDLVGGTSAAMVQFGLLHRLVGAGAAAEFEQSATYGLGKTAAPYISKSVLTGMAFGGLLTPVADQDEHFVRDRVFNGIFAGLSFGTLTAGSIGLKSTGKALLQNDVVANGLSGAFAGLVDSDARSLVTEGHLSSEKDRLQSISNFALGGAFAGALNIAHEAVKPTTGIKGVRTLADMVALADSTKIPEAPARYAYEDKQNIPPKPEVLAEDGRDMTHEPWYNRVAVVLRDAINDSSIPIEERKRIVAGFQQLGYGEETLHQIRNEVTGDIITVYGSAREDPFRNAKARWFAGMNARLGNALMTGGTIGVMSAANQGAYEAGGISIGVPAKFKFEVGGKPNGYQTHVIPTRDFFVRMELLKKANAFAVFPGGIGSLAEAADTGTHIQTEKMPQYLLDEFGHGNAEAPIYLVGSKYWKPTMNVFRAMIKAGTMSPKDLNLFTVVDDPRDIFKDLARRRAQGAAIQGDAPKQTVPTT